MMTEGSLKPKPVASLRAAALKVVEVLQANGYSAYFAGGCVRDELLAIEPKDYDVATDAHPPQVQKLFHRTIPVGEHFGVILVQLMGQRIEVATFRAEAGYRDHRRPDTVEFTDARTDAQRRDFTINGMFEDPLTNQVIDYVGGQADLKAGVIRAIGNPDERLREDHLRSLRAVRFSARFGFTLEAETASAIRRGAGELVGVSRERIGHELRTMFVEASAALAIELLEKLGLDAPALREELRSVNDDNNNYDADGGSSRIVARLETPAPFTTVLVAWALDRGIPVNDGGFVARWRKALVLTNDECAALREILAGIEAMQTGWRELTVARRKRWAAAVHFTESLRVLRAIEPKLAARVAADVADLKQSPIGLNPDPLVNGDDLAEMGLTPGPKFRQFLDEAYDRQLEGELLTREAALEYVKQLVKGERQ